MNKVNRIYWTQREWELVWAEFTRLPAVNPQMVEREDLIVNAMMVLPKERQPTLDTPARNRLFRLLSSKSWKVHPSSAKQAAKDAKEQQVKAEVKKALEGSEWSTKDPLPNLKRDPAVSLDVLLQNLEGINAEILRAKEEEAKKDLTIVRLFDENKALKDEVQRLKTVNPIAEAILHVEARFAGMQNDLFHRLTAWMETRLPQTPAQVTEKTLTAALSPAPVSVWSELGVFSDVWTDALNAIGGALDYFGRSLADAAGSYAVADSSAAQGLSRSSSLSMGL